MPMTWYDAAKDVLDAPPESKGAVYRLQDDTKLGQWRVAVEDDRAPLDKRTWGIWDLRRSASGGALQPVKVLGGLHSWRVAILAASACASSRPLRATLAAVRMAAFAVRVAGRVPEAVREEWGQR
jgi:hypothetical protein